MRFGTLGGKSGSMGKRSFNSLYEILYSINAYNFPLRSLSILFMRFSLLNNLDCLKTTTLSILFMRFKQKKKENKVKGDLNFQFSL